MGAIKINGETSGSTTITAPATGSDETIELSTALASKLDLAGGKILQIVRATDTTNRSTNSTVAVDAEISVTITPQKSDSAILLIWTGRFQSTNATDDDTRGLLEITDNSNNAVSGGSQHAIGTQNITGTGSRSIRYPLCLIGYSTPATTSATTYKGRWATISANVTLQLFNASVAGQLYAIEVSA